MSDGLGDLPSFAKKQVARIATSDIKKGTACHCCQTDGSPNQSTAIPKSIAERQALLASLQTYFTNHAAHENGPLNVTAGQAGTLFTALSDARSAVAEITFP